jgi:hypothetical protein
MRFYITLSIGIAGNGACFFRNSAVQYTRPGAKECCRRMRSKNQTTGVPFAPTGRVM